MKYKILLKNNILITIRDSLYNDLLDDEEKNEEYNKLE